MPTHPKSSHKTDSLKTVCYDNVLNAVPCHFHGQSLHLAELCPVSRLRAVIAAVSQVEEIPRVRHLLSPVESAQRDIHQVRQQNTVIFMTSVGLFLELIPYLCC